MNLRLIATTVGDLVKYDTSVNQIERMARAIFPFEKQTFPTEGISSTRAALVYDWLMTLGKHPMQADERRRLVFQFCRAIAPASLHERVEQALAAADVALPPMQTEGGLEFSRRDFHSAVHKHAKSLFVQGNYFHAVFEACKAYNKDVRNLAQSTRDGQELMMAVWDGRTGVLKITPCQSETDLNLQDGIKFLSAGMMRAVRNPTAHEPAIDWPISKEDALDLLSFISFLYRQLDKAVYFSGG
ncbi:TIGR02391 family protein [Microvirga sp. Mcv34]|uniref:TIGR02391 family protein n=1 Tax=Microvirga sp. Mcv34 TaxID=2926016 RepID=UPI0021C574FE|nr:TIGR02391 family protein [Microvirga sp. Mcv34]